MVLIRSFQDDDLPVLVEFSLRTWEPVFASLRGVVGDDVFQRLHPDWRADQEEAVRSSCSGPGTTSVAVLDDVPVGFVVVSLETYQPRMGAIDIIGVDPDHHRSGIAAALTAHALEHMRAHGMDIAVVETGGDPGHAPARAAYEAGGFTELPISRYFQLL